MEISEDDGEDTEEDKNSESDVCSESSDNEGFDNDEPDLEETLPPEHQEYQNYIVDDLHNQLEVGKD